MRIKVLKEIEVSHFKFRAIDNEIYNAMILAENSSPMSKVLVYWYENGHIANTWYSEDVVEHNFKEGSWKFISEIKE